MPGMASLNVLIHATNLWVERFLTPLMAGGKQVPARLSSAGESMSKDFGLFIVLHSKA